MYYYPFYLLTDNAVRNRNIAELLTTEQKKEMAVKKALYDSLPAAAQHKALYDLLELEKALTATLCDVLRADYQVFGTTLPKIDHWRVEEKAKRLLAVIKLKVRTLTHQYSDASFLIGDQVQWGDVPVATPSAWNDLVLVRVADIHRHVSSFIDNVRITVQTGQDAESMSSVGRFLEDWRAIAREVKEYTRLVSSL